MKLNINSESGYTLVEMLASIVIIVAIGSVIANVITSSLRGTNKVNVIESIRQSGNYILNQITKDVTYAQVFDGISTGINPEHNTVCPSLLPSPSPAPAVTELTIKTAQGLVVKYECSGSGPGSVLRRTITQTDGTVISGLFIDPSSSISLKSCSLSCDQYSGVPIIGVDFAIGSKSPSNLAENNSGSDTSFKTSITMRNYR